MVKWRKMWFQVLYVGMNALAFAAAAGFTLRGFRWD